MRLERRGLWHASAVKESNCLPCIVHAEPLGNNQNGLRRAPRSLMHLATLCLLGTRVWGCIQTVQVYFLSGIWVPTTPHRSRETWELTSPDAEDDMKAWEPLSCTLSAVWTALSAIPPRSATKDN